MSKNMREKYTHAGKILAALALVNSTVLPAVNSVAEVQAVTRSYNGSQYSFQSTDYSIPITADVNKVLNPQSSGFAKIFTRVTDGFIKWEFQGWSRSNNNVIGKWKPTKILDQDLSKHGYSILKYKSSPEIITRYKVIEQFSSELAPGESKVLTKGQNATRSKVANTLRQGSATLVQYDSYETTPVINEVVLKGTGKTETRTITEVVSTTPKTEKRILNLNMAPDTERVTFEGVDGKVEKIKTQKVLNGKVIQETVRTVTTPMRPKEISYGEKTVVKEVTSNKVIPFKTVYKDDSSRLEGSGNKMTQNGSTGTETTVSRTYTLKGVLKRTEQISKKVTKQPVDRIISRPTGKASIKTENKETLKDLKVEKVSDSNLFKGEEKVLDNGTREKLVEVYEVKSFNGKVLSKVKKSQHTVPGKSKRIAVGTKDPYTYQEFEQVEKIRFNSTVTHDSSRLEGSPNIVTRQGVEGSKKVKYKKQFNKGKFVKNIKVSETITKQPVNRIVSKATGKPTVTREDKIVTSPITTVREADPNMFQGEERVVSQGSQRTVKEVWETKIFKNQQLSKTKVSETVTNNGSPKVVKYGTKASSRSDEYTTTETINFATEYVNDYSRLETEGNRVTQEGSNGSKTIRYRKIFNKDTLVRTEKVSEAITKQPVKKIISVPKGKPTVTYRDKFIDSPLETVRVADSNLYVGEEKVLDNGAQKRIKEVWEIKTFNGREISNRKQSETVVTQPKPKRVAYGTKPTTSTEEFTTTETINFTTEYVNDNSRLETEGNRVTREGSTGTKTIRYRKIFNKGVFVRNEKISESVTKQPVNKIVSVPKGKVTVSYRDKFIDSPLETVRVADNNLFVGEEKVLDNGSQKRIKEVWQIRTFNGRELSNTKYSETVITQPRPKRVAYGTKPRYTETTTTNTRKEVIRYNTETRNDNNLLKGKRTVLTQGVNGEKEITTVKTFRNGVYHSERSTERILKNPTNEVVSVGTKESETRIVEVPAEHPQLKNNRKATDISYDVQEVNTLPPGEVRIIKEGNTYAYFERKEQVVSWDGRVISERVIGNRLVQAEKGLIQIGVGRKNTTTYGITVGHEFKNYRVTDIFHKIFSNFDKLKAESDAEKYRKAKNKDLSSHLWAMKDGNLTEVLPILNKELISQVNNYEYIDLHKLNQEFIALLNAERKSKGISPVVYSAELQSGADQRSREQVNHGSLRTNNQKHTRPDGTPFRTAFSYLDYSEDYLGENILQTAFHGNPYELVSEKYLAEVFFNQWKDSPGHYTNMMSPNYKSMALSFAFSNVNTFPGLEDTHYSNAVATQVLSVKR